MPSVETILNNLSERIDRLEKEQRRPRGRTNLAGAARYLGISDESLRLRHVRGVGPRRVRNGRLWSYEYADLDAHAEEYSA
jgi:hypothetical protein